MFRKFTNKLVKISSVPCLFIFQCQNLKDLGVKCLFICDTGNGSMDVLGHPRAIQFVENFRLAPKFYSFVNGEGQFSSVHFNVIWDLWSIYEMSQCLTVIILLPVISVLSGASGGERITTSSGSEKEDWLASPSNWPLQQEIQ